MGATTGSERLGTNQREAKKIIEGWHALYPGFRAAYYSAQERAKQWRDPDGNRPGAFQYIRLSNNRVRHFQEFAKYGQDAPFHAAWNFIIQGTAAIVTDKAILDICETLS